MRELPFVRGLTGPRAGRRIVDFRHCGYRTYNLNAGRKIVRTAGLHQRAVFACGPFAAQPRLLASGTLFLGPVLPSGTCAKNPVPAKHNLARSIDRANKAVPGSLNETAAFCCAKNGDK
jgi:hypothetical protein